MKNYKILDNKNNYEIFVDYKYLKQQIYSYILMNHLSPPPSIYNFK